MNINISYKSEQTAQRLENRVQQVQKRFDLLVMRDSNFYCPHDTGVLQKSVILSSRLGSGVLTWNTPYAKAQYYGYPNKPKRHNVNATGKWFETAKANKIKTWEKLSNDWYSTAR